MLRRLQAKKDNFSLKKNENSEKLSEQKIFPFNDRRINQKERRWEGSHENTQISYLLIADSSNERKISWMKKS